MKIGELAQVTGIKAETIRYYEKIGLLRTPDRTGSNYRSYGADDQERLAFIRHARALGFEISNIRSLLGLGDDPDLDCGEAGKIATGHLNEVEKKIEQLKQLRVELRRIVEKSRQGLSSDVQIIGCFSENRDASDDHS